MTDPLDPYTTLRLETHEGVIESLAADVARIKAALAHWGFALPEPDDGRVRISVEVPAVTGERQGCTQVSLERTEGE